MRKLHPKRRIRFRLGASRSKDPAQRARDTLAYLRSLPPWVDPAEAVSQALPLAEDLIQDTETGKFDIRPRPIAKPDLLSATCARIEDALGDVLALPQNGLNDAALEVRKLRRALSRFANDPQRLEMDFTEVHTSLMRKMAGSGELPPSDENIALVDALAEGAQGIRATHAEIAVNRRILSEQRLREMGPAVADALEKVAPVLDAITTGDLQVQMAEDVAEVIAEIRTRRLPGVTRADRILGASERVFGRSARAAIEMRKSIAAYTGDFVKKIHASTGYKAFDIITTLGAFVGIVYTLINFVSLLP